jgi:hypothetical protein
MDVSRLDQWEIVFEHADHQGMFLHFKTQETENELLLDGGNMGPQRTLYYRELIARFSHHLAMNWNLGEEINNSSTAQKQAWAQFFHDNDPYRHHIVIHNGVSHTDLMGPDSEVTGFSLQTSLSNFLDVHDRVLDYINLSAAAGKPWAVAADEPGDAEHALRPDNDAGDSHEDGRKHALWGTLMAGGWGNEWYFGYAHAHSDLTLNDFRSRDHWWDYTRYALEFFNDNSIPFWQMHNDNSISSASDDYAFVKDGEVYVVYLKNGGTSNLDLSGATGAFDVRWYDPRHGGPLQTGTVEEVSGGGSVSLGQPPNHAGQDWAILVTSTNSGNDPPPDNDPVPIFSDSFENGTWNGLWVEDSQNDWFRSTQRATDGNYSAEVDGSANDATLTTADAFDLSLFAGATLTFSWYIESGLDSDEYLAFDISLDGGSTWQNSVLRLDGNQDQENAWHHETVDLTPFLSSDFRFRFRADVSGSSEDANVDNVRLVARG